MTSAVAGALLPDSSPAPLSADSFMDFIQAWVVGLTGLDPKLVRPRWQPEPLNVPEATTNWCGLGVRRVMSDAHAAELHDAVGDGYNQMRRHEKVVFAASFYGPQALDFAEKLRDGAAIAQNRDVLSMNGVGFVECGDILSVPEFLKQQWYNRRDMDFSVNRQIVRNYGVLNLLGADIVLNNERYSVAIST